MKTKTLIGAALMSCALIATPTFAQDKMKDKAVEEVTDKAVSEGKSMAKKAMKKEAKKMMTPEQGVMIKGDKVEEMADETVKASGDPLIIETPEATITAVEGEMEMKDGKTTIMAKEIMTEPKPVMMEAPAPAPVAVEIACPSGTTAQPDGTCMITGDYEG